MLWSFCDIFLLGAPAQTTEEHSVLSRQLAGMSVYLSIKWLGLYPQSEMIVCYKSMFWKQNGVIA